MDLKIIVPAAILLIIIGLFLMFGNTKAPAVPGNQAQNVQEEQTQLTGDPDAIVNSIVADIDSEDTTLAANADAQVSSISDVQSSLGDLGTSFSTNEF